MESVNAPAITYVHVMYKGKRYSMHVNSPLTGKALFESIWVRKDVPIYRRNRFKFQFRVSSCSWENKRFWRALTCLHSICREHFRCYCVPMFLSTAAVLLSAACFRCPTSPPFLSSTMRHSSGRRGFRWIPPSWIASTTATNCSLIAPSSPMESRRAI